MKEPELVLRAKEEDKEAKGKVILEKQMHGKLTEVLRKHGDETVFGGSDDYLLRADLNSGDMPFSIKVGSQTGDADLPYVHLSFESKPLNRTMVFFENRSATVVDTSYEDFRKIVRMRKGKRDKALARVDLRKATKQDLLQFAEITDLLAEAVRDRVGQIDPVGFQNRLGIVA